MLLNRKASLGLLGRFLSKSPYAEKLHSPEEVVQLENCFAILNDDSRVKWYPKFGACILLFPVEEERSRITVHGLNGWKAEGLESSADYQFIPSSLFQLELPLVPSNVIVTLFSEFSSLIQKHNSNQQRTKSTTPNDPAILCNLLHEATTKVGISSDCRSTEMESVKFTYSQAIEFPLVCNAFLAVLESLFPEKASLTFRIMMFGVDLYRLNEILQNFPKKFDLQEDAFDTFMALLNNSQKKIQQLSDNHVNCNMLVPHLLDLRRKADAKRMKSWKNYCEAFNFSAANKNDAKRWNLKISELIHPQAAQQSAASFPALTNSPPLTETTLSDVKSFMNTCDKQGSWESAVLGVIHAERYCFGFSDDFSYTEVDIFEFLPFLELYQKLYKRRASKIVRNKENLASRKMLLVWILYCIVDAHLVREFSFCSSYGMSIPSSCLQYLVLCSLEERRVQSNVSCYLNERTNKKPLFSLQNQKDTLDMVNEYVDLNPSIRNAARQEQAAADSIIEQRAAEFASMLEIVKDYQVKLLEIDCEIVDQELVVETEDNGAREEYNKLKEEHDDQIAAHNRTYSYYRPPYPSFQKPTNTPRKVKLTSLRNTKKQLQNNLRSAKKIPAHYQRLTFSLPRDEVKACQVLFFVNYFPETMKLLSYFSLCACSFLGYRNPLVVDNWHNYVDKHGFFERQERKNYSKCVVLGGREMVSSSFKTDVTRIADPYVDCVHFADAKAITMGTNFDAERYNVVSDMDVTLPRFQKALNVFAGESDTSRSNWGLEAQLLIPEDWTKHQFLIFWSLRSYPHRQLAALIETLSAFLETGLPLSDESVRKLINQLLYQTGPLIDNSTSLIPFWFKDLEKENIKQLLYNTLLQCVELVAENMRYCESIQCLADCCAFFSQYYPPIRDITIKISTICHTWGKENLQEEFDAALDDMVRFNHIKAKQCLFYCYSIWCYSLGEFFMKEDIRFMCQLIVLINQGIQYEYSKKCSELYELGMLTMLSHLPRILEWMQDPEFRDDVLTNALQCAYESLAHIDTLEWKQGKKRMCNFTTTYDGVIYHVDIVTGQILADGRERGRLPSDITNHPLYKTIFECRTFAVSYLNSGVRKSINPTEGYYYEFYNTSKRTTNSSPGLIIKEIDRYSHTLELLEPHLLASLPTMVRYNSSYYLSRSKEMIIVRGQKWNERTPKYLITAGDSSFSSSHCYIIPVAFISLPWYEHDINGYERIINIPQDNKTIQLLSKFENVEFIHSIIVPGQEEIKYAFPRFELEFLGSSSLQYLGFSLAPNQQLCESFLGFTRYLILENRSRRKVLIPVGIWKRTNDSPSCLKIPDSLPSNRDKSFGLSFYVYDIHPKLGHFVGSCRAALLYLCSILLWSDSLMPYRTLKQTNAEEALYYLRSSYSSTPLRKEEIHFIEVIMEYSTRCPAVYLMAYKLLLEDSDISCINAVSSLGNSKYSSMTRIMKTRYVHEFSQPFFNIRRRLDPMEEKSIFGLEIHSTGFPSFSIHSPHYNSLSIPHFLTSEMYVEKAEKKLVGLVQSRKPANHSCRLPLTIDATSNLGKELLEEETESWNAARNLPIHSFEGDDTKFRKILKHAESERKAIESYLLLHITISESHSPLFNARKAANLLANPTRKDFLLLACDLSSSLLQKFNPFLNEKSREVIKKACFLWMKLCVLEDKMERILSAYLSDRIESMIEELLVTREWNVHEHPEWLAFEVEQQIQIRNIQYTVCKELLSSHGAFVQLNMGLGKTRVILPMLALAWSRDVSACTRIHILTPILQEALQYFRKALTQSVLTIRVYQLPYHRQIPLSKERASAMFKMVKQCNDTGGILMVAPEHRMSLQMAISQMEEEEEGKGALLDLLHFPYRDICDEVDAMLPNWELVYAIGDSEKLPAARDRWLAIDALLMQCREPGTELETLLASDHICERPNLHCITEQYIPPRFTDSPAFKSKENQIRDALVTQLLTNPPYHMKWIKNHPKQEFMIQYITNTSCTFPKELHTLHNSFQNVLVTLRGLLAFGILFHCMQKRVRVNFGIAFDVNGRNIAVPFRAADSPAERAEFSQPDCAVLYTKIAYFHSGLMKEQIIQTVNTLLDMGSQAQKRVYQEWFEISKCILSDEESKSIDSPLKLDVSNHVQVDTLCRAFAKNPRFINYWLNECILPMETMVFPNKLVGSGWNLAANNTKRIVGFSGTNDNKRLLPIQFTQKRVEVAELIATNGRMLSLMRTRSECFSIPSPSPMDIIELLCDPSEHYSALIDAGGLMAGMSNREVALELVKIHKNVIYYSQDKDTWSIIGENGVSQEQHLSPTPISLCFAFFDESRCRGSDLRLDSKALAMLTVGPNMRRDQLTQAAGRMRGLHTGQRLKIAIPEEISRNLLRITVDDLLSWCANNVIKHTANGLLLWAKQGMIFSLASTWKEKQDFWLPELYRVDDLYKDASHSSSISEVVEKLKMDYVTRTSDEYSKDIQDTIVIRGHMYGSHGNITGSLEQQSEKELEYELEVEKEQECIIPKRPALCEEDWDFSSITTASSIKELKKCNGIPMSDVIRYLDFSQCNETISWGSNLFITKNCLCGVQYAKQKRIYPLNQYLRIISGLLYFPNGSTLLLSERETDKLIPFFFENSQPQPIAKLVHYGFSSDVVLPIGCHIFAGKTMYPEGQIFDLEQQMRTVASQSQSKDILLFRHVQASFDSSSLDDAIKKARSRSS